MSIAQASGVLGRIENFCNYLYSIDNLHSVSLASAIENINAKSEDDGHEVPYVPFSTVSPISGSCSAGALSVAGIAWAMTMAVELILFTMVLVKSRRKDPLEPHKDLTRCDLLCIIAKDSGIYFGM